MKSSVYIETTIPSFYHEVRTELDMVARRAWTREWWDDYRKSYELFTSDAVIDELERGNFPNKGDALSLIEDLSMLNIDQPVIDTVSAYISHQVSLPIRQAMLCIWQLPLLTRSIFFLRGIAVILRTPTNSRIFDGSTEFLVYLFHRL